MFTFSMFLLGVFVGVMVAGLFHGSSDGSI